MAETAFELLPDAEPYPGLPLEPAGWRILIEPAPVPTHSAGGIELPPEAKAQLEYLRNVGQVIRKGSLCYVADERFLDKDGSGGTRPVHFCDVGDWVMVAKHAGQPLSAKWEGEDLRFKLINDDEVLMVAKDPSVLITTL